MKKMDDQPGGASLVLTEDEEAFYQQLSDDFSSNSGEMWDVALSQLAEMLPDGYALNEDSRIVRLDPGLPDYVELDGVYGKIRVPAVEVRAGR